MPVPVEAPLTKLTTLRIFVAYILKSKKRGDPEKWHDDTFELDVMSTEGGNNLPEHLTQAFEFTSLLSLIASRHECDASRIRIRLFQILNGY